MNKPFKRIQGRPAKGEGDVGRERLVEAARAILRAPIAAELSRKAVADAAGVTPALVSYYFPEREALMAAATAPLVGERLEQLLAIIDAPDSRPERLRRALTLLIEMHAREAALIDHALDFSRRTQAAGAQRKLLLAAYERLRDFFVAGIEAGDWRDVDPDQVLFALWGMCKLVSASGTGQPCPPDRPAPERADIVIDLALNGLRAR